MKETIDYSKKENWFQIPEITKDVDTFYIYATEYIMGSLLKGGISINPLNWKLDDTYAPTSLNLGSSWPNVSQPIRRM